MAFKLCVLIVHGMGSQEEKFSKPVEEELIERILDLGADPTQVR
jgi:hypothetical protein